MGSGGFTIWVLSTSFQKNSIGWPQQPPTQEVSDISEKLDFWWSITQKGIIIGYFGTRNDPTFRISNFFDLTGPQWPPSERVPYISEKLDFWWSIQQKITSIGYFGTSDNQTIRTRNLFWEIGLKRLLRPVRLQRPLRSMRLERFFKAWKITQVLKFNDFRTNIT